MKTLTTHLLLICLTLTLSMSTWVVSASTTTVAASNTHQMMSKMENSDCHQCVNCDDMQQCAQGQSHCVSSVAIPAQQSVLLRVTNHYLAVILSTDTPPNTVNSSLYRPPISA